MYAYCENNPIAHIDPSGFFVITISMLITAAIIGAVSGGIIGAAYGGLTAIANGQNFWVGALIGLLSGAFMGAGSGIGAVFLAPALAGASITFATASGVGFVMGTAISSGAAIAIGSGVAFGAGAIGGAFSDLSSQLVYNGRVSDWGSVAWSALEWGAVNTISAFSCAGFESFLIADTAVGYGMAEAITVTSLVNIGCGTGGFWVDVLRANTPKPNPLR
jgi:hypothetical protein